MLSAQAMEWVEQQYDTESPSCSSDSMDCAPDVAPSPVRLITLHNPNKISMGSQSSASVVPAEAPSTQMSTVAAFLEEKTAAEIYDNAPIGGLPSPVDAADDITEKPDGESASTVTTNEPLADAQPVSTVKNEPVVNAENVSEPSTVKKIETASDADSERSLGKVRNQENVPLPEKSTVKDEMPDEPPMADFQESLPSTPIKEADSDPESEGGQMQKRQKLQDDSNKPPFSLDEWVEAVIREHDTDKKDYMVYHDFLDDEKRPKLLACAWRVVLQEHNVDQTAQDSLWLLSSMSVQGHYEACNVIWKLIQKKSQGQTFANASNFVHTACNNAKRMMDGERNRLHFLPKSSADTKWHSWDQQSWDQQSWEQQPSWWQQSWGASSSSSDGWNRSSSSSTDWKDSSDWSWSKKQW